MKNSISAADILRQTTTVVDALIQEIYDQAEKLDVDPKSVQPMNDSERKAALGPQIAILYYLRNLLCQTSDDLEQVGPVINDELLDTIRKRLESVMRGVIDKSEKRMKS